MRFHGFYRLPPELLDAPPPPKLPPPLEAPLLKLLDELREAPLLKLLDELLDVVVGVEVVRADD